MKIFQFAVAAFGVVFLFPVMMLSLDEDAMVSIDPNGDHEEQMADRNEPKIDKRQTVAGDNRLWPGGLVPYKLDASSRRKDYTAIHAAIQQWQRHTCLKFIASVKPDEPHIVFKKVDGCESKVGRVESPLGQDVNIGKECNSLGGVMHEIGHALGFYHQESRPDRGEHVVVLTGNAKSEDDKKKFNVVTNTRNYGIPYDLGSIMHSGPDEFAEKDRNTLVTKDVWKQFLIGQRDALSFWDIKLANVAYKCAGTDTDDGHCGKETCTNGGFLNKVCRCVCPPGFSGNRCHIKNWRIPPPDVSCGGTVTEPVTIMSPNYPENYPAGSKCVWVITAPEGKRVRASFTDFHLHEEPEGEISCHLDVLEMRWGGYNGTKYCGTSLRGKHLTFSANKMTILFHTNRTYKGFTADITFVPPANS